MDANSLESESAKKNSTLVIYHADCMDGFASAWAAWCALEMSADYVPCHYGHVPDFVDYGLIYIVDFSFDRSILTEMSSSVAKVIVLDHHKTAAEALQNWDGAPDNLEIVFDMERSGAGITWNYFYPVAPIPELIKYVQDRDLWKFNLIASKEINAVVAVTPKTFRDYSVLNVSLTHDWDRIKSAGEYLSLQHQQICEQIVQDAREVTINGQTGLACNCTPQFSSEVGNILAKKSGTFGSTYHSGKTGDVKYSLRSIGDYDVSAIAKQFGGGGHKNAAGFTLVANETDRSDCIKIWSVPV